MEKQPQILNTVLEAGTLMLVRGAANIRRYALNWALNDNNETKNEGQP
jgi:hypothetical protein